MRIKHCVTGLVQRISLKKGYLVQKTDRENRQNKKKGGSDFKEGWGKDHLRNPAEWNFMVILHG